MRRYAIRINETDHILDVEEYAHDTFTVHLADGQSVDVALTGHHDLPQAVIAPEIDVRRNGPSKERGDGSSGPSDLGHCAVKTRPEEPSPRLPVENQHFGGQSSKRSADRPAARPAGGTKTVTAPMPGVVLSVEVAPGASVTRGQTLLVLEAMKMKNDIKADQDGVVASVPVSAGAQVKHGDLLLEFEG